MRARWLRVYRHSLTRFAAFGLLGLGIDVALLGILLRLTPVAGPVAVTIAFAVTYVINFFLNRAFSFAAHGAVAGQLARFLPQVLLDYLLTIAAVAVLTGWGTPLVPARVIAGGTNATVNYLLYRFWTFSRG